MVKVPGFLPGKTVPESILLGYVGKRNIQKAAIESILKRTLPHAVASVGLKDLPKLDESLADRLLPGCTTLKQVEESLLQKFLEVEQTTREQVTDNAILGQLPKMIEVDIPQSLFEEQGRQLYGAKLLEIQFSMDELVKEVENSIAEFKRQKQEYGEERAREQELNVPEQDVEQLLVSLILDNRINGHIDRVNRLLETWGRSKGTKKYAAVEKWNTQLKSLYQTINNRVC